VYRIRSRGLRRFSEKPDTFGIPSKEGAWHCGCFVDAKVGRGSNSNNSAIETQVRYSALIFCLLLVCGCAFSAPVREQSVGAFGRFEFRSSGVRSDGFVIGVTHANTEPDALEYARSIGEASGAGLVIAYGFGTNGISVAQPVVHHQSPIAWTITDSGRPPSVYSEFKKFLRAAIDAPLGFYVGLRVADIVQPGARIEVASAGFDFEQLAALKRDYVAIRDGRIKDSAPRLELALDPLDDISWNAFAVKNHGVLMLAEKGLVLRLPKLPAGEQSIYREILGRWVLQASAVARRTKAQVRAETENSAYGRIDIIPSRKNIRGIVIGAPHGSFDWYTRELVEELSYRTALASVVTRGFTPTECDGWRINVNRPTERRYPTDTLERTSDRAKEVYRQFAHSVFEASGAPLNLYIDIHQNSTEPGIEVATLGITRNQAVRIKKAYAEIRNHVLRDLPEVAKVDLNIEPVDPVSIGAWAAKDHGILRLAKSSLHFELPAQSIFYRDAARRAYTKILAELIDFIAADRAEAER